MSSGMDGTSHIIATPMATCTSVISTGTAAGGAGTAAGSASTGTTTTPLRCAQLSSFLTPQ